MVREEDGRGWERVVRDEDGRGWLGKRMGGWVRKRMGEGG